jgi:hypothetical protein
VKKNIPADEIDRVLEILKEAVVLSDSLQVDHIMRQLEAECKRVLSLFKGLTQKKINELIVLKKVRVPEQIAGARKLHLSEYPELTQEEFEDFLADRASRLEQAFDAECERVQSEMPEFTQKEIDKLSDANEVFWLERSYPHYASPFGEAINALAAVFLLKDYYARRDVYADDFTAWAKEEANRLGNLLKEMRLGELQAKSTKSSIAGAVAGRTGGKSRREKLSARNQKIENAAEELITDKGLRPHELVRRLKKRTFDGDSPEPKQLRRILRKTTIIPPPKKRPRR